MKIARYMGLTYGMKSVIEGLSRLSKASEFNDPFDCDGVVEEGKAPSPVMMPDNERRIVENRIGDFTLCYTLWMTQFMNAVRQKTLIDNNYRILCFREYQEVDDASDRLFWSHYADNCRGVRIIFDMPEDFLDGWFRPIVYSNQCPVCDLSKCVTRFHDPELMRFMKNRIFTKGMAWKNEKEWRLCVPLNEENVNTVLVQARDDWYLRFDQNRILQIDFGVNVPVEAALSWKTLCSNCTAMQGTKFRHAEKISKDYTYTYVEL